KTATMWMDIGLNVPAKDTEIWNYALTHNLIIVTNDDDFLNLATAKGFPPKVVLLRTGNQSNVFLERLLIKRKKHIEELFSSAEYSFLQLILPNPVLVTFPSKLCFPTLTIVLLFLYTGSSAQSHASCC